MMSLTASFLDLRFLLLLVVLALARWLWPSRGFAVFGALGSAAVVGLAAPTTFLVIAVITLAFLFPVHRMTVRAREREWPAWLRRSLVPAAVGLMVTLLVISKSYRYFTIPLFG